MKNNIKVTIGSKEYNIFMVSADAQFRIQLRLIKAGAIPFLQSLVVSSDIKMIGMTIIANILDKLDEKDIQEMVSTLLSNAREVGNPEPISVDDFQGEMHLYNSIIIESLKLNFGDFMQALLQETEVNPTPKNS